MRLTCVVAQPAEALHDLRQPRAESHAVGDVAEVGEPQQQHRRMTKGLQRRQLGLDLLALLLPRQLGRDPAPFVVGEPSCLLRPVREVEEREDARQHRREAFHDEQPPPPRHPEPVEAQERGGDDRAEHVGRGDRGHEHRDGLRPVALPEPVSQVDDDAGEEARLGDAEEEPDPVELRRARDEPGERRQGAPRDQARPDEDARAPQLEQHRRRHLQQEISDEEDAGAEAEDGVREAELAGHLQRGEAHVDADRVVEDVEHEQERQQPQGDAPGRSAGDVCGRGRGDLGHGGLRLSRRPSRAGRSPAAW